MRPNKSSDAAADTIATETDPAIEARTAELEAVLKSAGPAAAADELIRAAREELRPRALLDALLLKARLELGMTPSGMPADQLSDELKTTYEDRYVDALRTVGRLLLEKGDIPAAWPYFRVIGEKDEIRAAIEAFDPADADEHAFGAVIDVAFQQQVHPLKGFAWILDRYGICSAISSFEALPADDAVRSEAAALLTKALYAQLQYALASEIERREEKRPEDTATVAAMLEGRSWIYDDDAYAIDVSHLSSVVRLSPLLKSNECIALALELATYGAGLSDRFRYDGLPPFEDVYADHSIYLKALLGTDSETAVSHFRGKLKLVDSGDDQPRDPLESLPAQTLVNLLSALGRTEEAIALAAEHLIDVPESYLVCPSLSVLCRKAGRPDLLADAAARNQDWALFLAARIEENQKS
jgi:hypothetical protein